MQPINEEKLKQMESFVRLWGKLNQLDALELLAAYRATRPATPVPPAAGASAEAGV